MTCSGSVGSPRASYVAAIAACSGGQAGGVVAVPAEVGRQLAAPPRRTPRRCPGGARGRGAVEVDRRRRRRAGAAAPGRGRAPRPPGTRVKVPEPLPRLGVAGVPQLGVGPGHGGAARRRARRSARARWAAGRRRPIRPSPMSSAQRVGEPGVGRGAVEGRRRGRPPRGGGRWIRLMQATVPRLAIEEKANLAQLVTMIATTSTPRPAPRPSSTSARSPSCAPAGSAGGCRSCSSAWCCTASAGA